MADEPKATEYYHSKKDRVFLRGITGHYNLKEELARLRALPRVRKGKEIKFVDGPQVWSRHYMEPKDGLTQTLHIHLNSVHGQTRHFCHGTLHRRWPLRG